MEKKLLKDCWDSAVIKALQSNFPYSGHHFEDYFKTIPEKNLIIELEAQRMEWAIKTFPTATALSSLDKLKEEIDEIATELIHDHPSENLVVEYADALKCLFDSAGRSNIKPIDIFAAFAEKLKINIAAEWKDNGNGTYSRIKK